MTWGFFRSVGETIEPFADNFIFLRKMILSDIWVLFILLLKIVITLFLFIRLARIVIFFTIIVFLLSTHIFSSLVLYMV